MKPRLVYEVLLKTLGIWIQNLVHYNKVYIKKTLDYNTLFFPLSIGFGPESIVLEEI